MAYRMCTVCKVSGSDAAMVKYGARVYAHFGCYLDAGKSLRALSPHLVSQFPHQTLKARGLVAEAEAIISKGER